MTDKSRVESNERLWSAKFIHLLCISLLSSTSFYMINPILSTYVVSLGGTLALGGVVVGVFAFTALITRPIGGLLADHYNGKYLIIIAAAIMGTANLLHMFANNIPSLIVLRIFAGAGYAINGITVTALGSTVIPRNCMGEGIGYLGISNVLASAIGPNLGVIATDKYGYTGLFAVSFTLAALSVGLALLFRHSNLNSRRPAGKFHLNISALFEKDLIPLSVFALFFAFCIGFTQSFVTVLGEERSIPNIEWFFTANVITLLILRPLTGKISDRKGFAVILAPAYLCSAVAMFISSRAYSFIPIIIAAALLAAGQGAGQPAIQAECIRRLPERRGVATSMYYLGIDIGQGLGPMIGGSILTATNFSVTFSVMGLFLVIGLIIFMVYERKRHIRKQVL